ncbi:inositol monophosphatase [Shinella kummerowiae]|jgi:myo-inositol-1(or 4)-monophosphatase|uniref:Inositol monophosphatase n=1 Tax=Shinella kummerowiae TaxID=417745 RepID=A0A6N8SED6_9HYPH|nr:inositol monophosphatase [Shinella kummerowiae]MXN45312.1 inositol monophosphatase [Shinella kummerowiae]
MTDPLLRTAIAAALLPAPALLAAFRQQMAVDYKRDRHDPVTEHDRRAEAAIRALIFHEVPDSTFMGEEGGTTGTGRVQWFVDPIDGTSNFAAGIAFWCTSVGAVVDDTVVAAAIHDPVSGAIFSASSAGAWLNDQPLAPANAAAEPHATLITGYPVARDFALDGRDAALDRFGRLVETVATVRRPGSAALSIAHVAAGWADAALGFSVNPWDVAAASLILRQAGGRYLPLSLGKCAADAPAHRHPGYIALRRGADYPKVVGIAEEISVGRSQRMNRIFKTEGLRA